MLDKSYTVHHRNLKTLAIETYKVKNNLSPSFMKTIFPLSTNNYELRSQSDFKMKNIRTVCYRGAKTGELIPQDTRTSSNLKEKLNIGLRQIVTVDYVKFIFIK